jgi:multidrug efflux system membrane fusion protein
LPPRRPHNTAALAFSIDREPLDDRTTTDFARTQPLDKPLTRKRAAPKMRRRLGLLILVVAVAAVGWWFYGRQPAPPPARQNAFAAAMPVVAAPAVTGDIDITLNGLGTVTSLATVTIRSQISGQLVRIAYQEGQMINKGDLVAEIDSRPYELALAQAHGALERDQALLQTAELDLKRYQDLAKTNAIPRQQLDTQVSLVAQDKGPSIADQAQINTQKLNMPTHIIAPITGRAGLRLVVRQLRRPPTMRPARGHHPAATHQRFSRWRRTMHADRQAPSRRREFAGYRL